MSKTVKFIVDQALRVETVFPEGKIKILTKQSQKRVKFTDDEVLVLISCMFLCTLTQVSHTLEMPDPNTFIQMITRD